MEIEFVPHVEEIKRALDNEIDGSNIIADLKKLLESEGLNYDVIDLSKH
jgi:hypothetical protein